MVGVNFVKMKINEHEVNEFIEKWKDEGRFYRLTRIYPTRT